MENAFYYDGTLRWKNTTSKRIKPGQEVGCLSDKGYMVCYWKGKGRRVHRLIWELLNGPIPEGLQIDHINGERSDNRIENLRLVTNQENQYNVKGVKGYVKVASGNYSASISIKGKKKAVGTFKTAKEAREAYLKAKKIHHNIGVI